MPAKCTATTHGFGAKVWDSWQSLDRGWKATIIGCTLFVIAGL